MLLGICAFFFSRVLLACVKLREAKVGTSLYNVETDRLLYNGKQRKCL